MPKYKQHMKVQRPLTEISDTELENIWWKAFRRDEFSTVYCDPKVLRIALAKLLEQ